MKEFFWPMKTQEAPCEIIVFDGLKMKMRGWLFILLEACSWISQSQASKNTFITFLRAGQVPWKSGIFLESIKLIDYLAVILVLIETSNRMNERPRKFQFYLLKSVNNISSCKLYEWVLPVRRPKNIKPDQSSNVLRGITTFFSQRRKIIHS